MFQRKWAVAITMGGGGTLFNIREELQKFKMINLEGLEESIPDMPDDVKSSILLYNKAIESIGKGSEDIAIIELKKAISINPGFHEAKNLLGLCYAYTGEKEKASSVFEKIIELERNGIQAYAYIRNLGGEIPESLQIIPDGEEIPLSTVGKAVPPREPSTRAKKKSNVKRNIAIYGVCFLLGALITFIAVYQFMSAKGTEPPANNEDEIKTLEEENSALQHELNDMGYGYAELENKNKDLQNKLNEANSRTEYFMEVRRFLEADLLEKEGRYEEAADLLLEIDGETLEPVEKTWYEMMREKLFPMASLSAYNEGRNLCQVDRDYEKGLEKLSRVFLYQEDFQSMEALLYYTGKCHQGVGEYDEAMKLYNRILEEYPSGYYEEFVLIRIAEIEEATGEI